MDRKVSGNGSDLVRWKVADIFIIILVAIIVIYTLLIYEGIAGANERLVFETLLLGIVIIELLGVLTYVYFAKRIDKEEAGPLRNLFRVLAYMILIVILLVELNINVTGLLVSAGFLGIVVGLAAQSTLANFISGIYLLTSQAFEPGDSVIIHTWQYTLNPPSYPHDKFVPGFSGVIKSIGVLYTEMTNEEHLPMLVPNSIVAQALLINYHRAKEHMTRIQFDVDIRISFGDIDKLIRRVMSRNKTKVENYRINIDYLNNNLYVVTIHAKVDEADRQYVKTQVYNELLRYLNNVHAKLGKTKVPHYKEQEQPEWRVVGH